jgi:UDP-2-acetamido-3-amino-2,3-dideoxy-glucuronate N-acetyltransferase
VDHQQHTWLGTVSPRAVVASTTKIWELAQVREHASVGENCIIGRGAYIGSGVVVGKNCKIQNDAMIYEPAVLEDGVFIGPNVVLTNDHFPRAINPDGTLKSASDWAPVGVTIKYGASVGAHSVCIAPVVIGEWALVGSGSVVTKDVPSHAIVVGNPARQIGWVGKTGQPLVAADNGEFVCPTSQQIYVVDEMGQLLEKE